MFNTHKFWPAVFMTLLVAVSGAFLASVLSPASAANEPVATGDFLELEISGVRNDQGSVIVMVFDNETAWETEDYNSIIEVRELKAGQQILKLELTNLTAGPYAISMWHDENANGEFDEAGGYPTEGWGLSGAKSLYDEPGWNEARVMPGKVNMKMVYID